MRISRNLRTLIAALITSLLIILLINELKWEEYTEPEDSVVRKFQQHWKQFKSSSSRLSALAKLKNSSGTSQVDTDPTAQEEYKEGINQVREMMKHAWSSYEKVIGADEVEASSGEGKSLFSIKPVGLSAIASLDTLFLMSLEKEFERAKDWVITEFDFTSMEATISTFRLCSEFLGGLLGAYTLSGDVKILAKASELGNVILKHINAYGVPSIINFANHQAPDLEKPSVVCLATIRGISLDLLYLGDLLGDASYQRVAFGLRDEVKRAKYPMGDFFTEQFQLDKGEFDMQSWGVPYSLGWKAGPAYEYLIKDTLYVKEKDPQVASMARTTVEAIRTQLFDHYAGQHQIVLNVNYHLKEEFDQSACFAPGLVTLLKLPDLEEQEIGPFLRKMKELVKYCLGLMKKEHQPEQLINPNIVKARELDDLQYHFWRPRVLESLVILWRLTGDVDYRRFGLEIIKFIELNWRRKYGYLVPGSDTQSAYFMADTLKYLFLLFSSSSILPLDEHVFNTAGHVYRRRKGDAVLVQSVDLAALHQKVKLRRTVRIQIAKLDLIDW